MRLGSVPKSEEPVIPTYLYYNRCLWIVFQWLMEWDDGENENGSKANNKNNCNNSKHDSFLSQTLPPSLLNMLCDSVKYEHVRIPSTPIREVECTYPLNTTRYHFLSSGFQIAKILHSPILIKCVGKEIQCFLGSTLNSTSQYTWIKGCDTTLVLIH